MATEPDNRRASNTRVPKKNTMTSSNRNIFRVTGPLRGEFTGHRWIPLSQASDAELWYFLWSALEQTVEQTIDLRRYRAHYDVIVMKLLTILKIIQLKPRNL